MSCGRSLLNLHHNAQPCTARLRKFHAKPIPGKLRPLADGGAKTLCLLHDPPLSFFSEAYGATLSFTGNASEPRMTIEPLPL
jgi:hypothetical protein